MKKFVYTMFVAFWTCALTIAALDVLTPSVEAESSENGSATYTLAEVAEHDRLDDCWMVIEGKVYDFTDYIPEHPASPSAMKRWCGREATEGMRTKGYGANHSPRAWSMMNDYLVGELATE